jgi:hypothetical protein
MPKYTNKTKIEAFLGKTITESLDDIINSVEKYIDNYTGRNFKADTIASARVYNGDNTQNLLIDDCISITKVEQANDQYGDSLSEITESNYKLLPLNYAAQGLPIRKIHLRSSIWGVGVGNHQITAKWGFSLTAPDDIVWVATFLASTVYQTGINGNVGGVSSERIGEYSVNFKNENELSEFKKAEDILNNYKIYNI